MLKVEAIVGRFDSAGVDDLRSDQALGFTRLSPEVFSYLL